MKNRYILTSLMVLMFAAFMSGQTWKKVTSPSLTSYSDSYFVNATTGWLVGTAGSIRKTIDGGKTWTTISTTITEDLKSVYFLDANTGFIGSATKLYKSTNGFSTFTSVDVTGVLASPTYSGVYFSDAQKGWFLSSTSSAGKVLQTTDGGTTWATGVNHTTGNLQILKFFSASAGIVAGGGSGKCDIYYTKDGSTWTKGTAPTFPAGVYTRTDIRSLYLFNANTAIAGGWGSSAAGLQPTIFIKTTDGGATWTYLAQAEANKTYEYSYDICFKDANNGLSAGGATKSSNILRTTDGGLNWVPLNTPSAFQVNRLFAFGDNVIAVTSSSSLLKSTNFGTSWELLTPISNTTMTKLFAVNNNVIYAGGQKGVIIKTTDGGNSWKSSFQVANNVCININGLYFISETLGYSANSYGMIAKTTDGGTTWTAVKKDTTAATVTNNAVAFTSANVGFVVGQAASNVDVIYKTTDGGATFTSTKSIVLATLNAVAFYNAQSGIAVGAKMKAVYTKDGGATWTASTITGVPTAAAANALNGVTFISATEAIAVGDKVSIMTTDGGVTWNYINVTIAQTLNGVAFLNNNTWAVGTKSTSPKIMGILQSTDKGQSWTNTVNYTVFDTTSNNNINDVAITPSGAAFVCGGASAIYTNSTAVGVEENENELPIVFELKQNYPNPFNPVTKISYSINQSGIVKLNIYDVLGRLVKTILNQYQNAGNHSIEFDASRLSSGAYIYTMSINDFIASKKMLLVK
ncbi:hypothetical protein C0389_05870 [bacterium]|nr:hypothetical protein [bacterium]